METTNNIDKDNGISTGSQESLPSTTSVLDKSRSLFGSPTGVRPVPVVNDTPLDGNGTSPVTEVAMETDDVSEKKEGSSPKVSPTKPEEPPADTTSGDTAESSEEVEEAFEKKVVSMDTSDAGVEETGTDAEEIPQNADEEQVAEGDGIENDAVGEEEEDEEEEEVPKKKAKRAALSEEDEEEEEKSDDQPMETDSVEAEEPEAEPEPVVEVENPKSESPEPVAPEEPEEPKEPEVAEMAEVEEEAVAQPEENGDEEANSDSSRPLEIDESDKVEEEEEAIAEESVEEAAAPKTPEQQAEGVPIVEDGNVTPDTPAPQSAPRSSRGRRSQGQATPSSSTPKRSVRARPSIIRPTEDDSTSERVDSPIRGRLSRGLRREEDNQEEDVVGEASEKTEEVEASPSKRGRGKRSVAVREEPEEAPEEAPATEEEPEAEETVEEEAKPRGRGRRSGASAAPTPRSARGRGKKTEVNEEAETVEKEEETEESPSKKPTRTPRGRKSTEKAEPVAEDTADAPSEEPSSSAQSSSRRSTRTRSTPKATPVAETKRTPARGRKKQASVGEEAVEEAEETTEATTSAKKARRTPKIAASSSKKNDGFDPYDLDTEMEHHPEPLKNIHFQMEVQNFGAVKYAKAGKSEAKYSMTEKAAESRVADLQTSPADKKDKRSLADMTPGKEKKPRASTGRRPRAKKEEAASNDVEMEDVSAPNSVEAPASSNRGRKRKSEVSEMTPSAKREPELVLRTLSDEEQLQADHPQDNEEDHAPGARVYAVFQKMFYPAVILNERDAMGRFKLQFTTDKVVKSVPNSGIVPLRGIVPGKIAIIDEKEARVDAGPNDISAEEWNKGKVKVTILDDDGEPTDETKTVNWKELTFDMSEWRDYVKTTEKNASAVAASNITITHAARPRKPVYTQQPAKAGGGRRKKTDTAEPDATPADEDQLLPMKPEAVGKNIFAGKIFMLTSANRNANPANVPAMLKKNNLREFILLNGGTVTESWDDEYPSTVETLLVSDTYYRTHKYLAALARGIPCVKNVWLQKCGEMGECVDYTEYVLPAGSSIFDDSNMPAPTNPSELLKGKTIYIYSTHPVRERTQLGLGGTFIEIWEPILVLMGAKVLNGDYPEIIEKELKFDVVLVDKTFCDEIMEYADKINAGKVTSEWVIQTIILGRAPEPDAHPKFDPFRLHHSNRRHSSSS